GVDRATKGTLAAGTAADWSAAGVGRAGAHLVSLSEGRPAYGGTPSDESVRRAILALKARGLEVTLYPFLMMDVPPGNALPDPWGGSEQAAYPWRGRITCHPAPGQSGSPDGTAAAGAQVAALFGTAAPGDFHAAGTMVSYSGPAEWTLRRMVLHYAKLASLAGGVDALLIGSEMAALTRVRSGPGVYPAAAALAALAADVKSIVGAGTLVSYAADWTEYGAHAVAPDGSELRFPLDPLWASPAIDFVGIDWYPPIADWRDGDGHLDAAAAPTIYDPAYLTDNVRGGEGFDWYYADDAARAAQTRLPITDGAYSEPWVYRPKDLAAWWSHAHHERAGGVRLSEPTAWVPGAKPVRLMEVGCAAVDKGANRPSSFPDPKSSETGFPPFSNRRRDDLMQRRHLEATLDAFATDAVNPPAAGLPGRRMVDVGAIHLWSWDARPFPAFPIAAQVWADGANWETGHWLTGRLGSAPLAELAATLCADFGIAGVNTAGLRGVIDGYVVDRPMSARAALEPLARAFAFDLAEQDAALTLRMRGGRPVAILTDDDLLRREEAAELRRVRGAESELPRQVSIGFLDSMADYRRAAAASRRLVGAARIEAGSELAMVTCDAVAEAAAETWLQDAWAARDTLSFALAPSRLALEPGDVVTLNRDGRTELIEILAIEDTERREVSARSIDPNVFTVAARAPRGGQVGLPPAYGPPEALLLALPALDATEPARLAYLAAFASPWPGALAVWRAVDGASFERIGTLAAPAVIGETLNALGPAPVWRFDRGARLEVKLHGGLLAAASEAAVLDGANGLALIAPDGGVEVLQFTEAELIGPLSWRLEGLLRGQLGTERFADLTWPAGTRVVRLDRNLAVAAQGIDLLGRPLMLRTGRADRDHGDPDVTEIAGTVSGLALTPLAPVRAQARRGPDGVALRWIRRARVNADGWEAVDIPLGEEREAYRLEIFDGISAVRTVEVPGPGWLYANADEAADFGGPQATLSVRIAQLSATIGAGQPLAAVLTVF
ncbi:MAG TPA: glycoside hydrolase/phage tail family protein, partial [Xanthobacteraceae bacterium]|nr:glycoside hydrolase/phage tail family protein [Xanthobacteraceae bacterium]